MAEGAFWYDTAANQLKILQSGVWVNDPSLGPGYLSDFSGGYMGAWEAIDFNKLFSDVLYDVETRLWEAAPTSTSLAFDFDTTFSMKRSLFIDSGWHDIVVLLWSPETSRRSSFKPERQVHERMTGGVTVRFSVTLEFSCRVTEESLKEAQEPGSTSSFFMKRVISSSPFPLLRTSTENITSAPGFL